MSDATTISAGFEEPLDEERRLNYSFWAGATILKGSVTPRILFDVFLFGLIAETIVLLSLFSEQRWGLSLSIPHGPFSAAGAVLGLLLVLRTNAGYDRWWEARKLWGGIVNQSRNLGVAALAYGPKNAEWRCSFVQWAAAYPHIIRRSLRHESKMPEVAQLVGMVDAMAISKADHMPSATAKKMGELLQIGKKAGMDDFAFLQMEQQRSMIVDYLGGCERIRNTPLARSSAILVRQFIMLFLVTLPFASMADFNKLQVLHTLFEINVPDSVLFVPLFIMLLSVPLLSLDRIGMELQNPFDVRRIDHLPLDAICHTIEKNLLEMLKKDPVVIEEGMVQESLELHPDLAEKIARSNSGDTMIS